MKLLVVSQSRKRQAVERRLSNALRIEAYFRCLCSENHGDEVLHQWKASRQLVTRALEEYSALRRHPDARRSGTAAKRNFGSL